jgi:hypothetical protein
MKDKIKKYNLAIQSIQHLIKPMKEKLDIDELIEEQHYKGADKDFIDGLAEEMQLEGTIEELLEII